MRWCFEKINANPTRVAGNSKGTGFSKAKSFKENMNQNWSFHRDSGVETKHLTWEGCHGGVLVCYGTIQSHFFLVIEICFMCSFVNCLYFKALFKPPLFRDYIMSSGMCNVTRESCEYILTEKGPGNSVVIVVGGAEEAFDAHPGTYTLILKPRKGFIKLALRTGWVCRHLLPSYILLTVWDKVQANLNFFCVYLTMLLCKRVVQGEGVL